MLAHLKVLDLAGSFGAYAGRLLASLGAQVIRVEPPGGDPGRADALAYAAAHAGKTCLALDPAAEADQAAFRALLDVAGHTLRRGGRARRLGPDRGRAGGEPYATLVSVRVLPHGDAAGMDLAPATDLTVMALSGIMHIVGEPGRPPLTLPGGQASALAGTQAAIAALIGINARAADGRGQHATVSAYQSAVLAGYRDPIVWEWTGRLGQRTGNRLIRGGSGVRQVWECQDGYVTWSMVDNPPMMRAMASLMREHDEGAGFGAIAWDSTLVANTEQREVDRLEAEVAIFFLRFPRATLAGWSGARALGLSVITTPAGALAEPHWAERGFWRDIVVGGAKVVLPGAPFVTDAPLPERLAAPDLVDGAAFGA